MSPRRPWSSCLMIAPIGWPVATSQSCAVLSWLAVAIVLPSGLYNGATHPTFMGEYIACFGVRWVPGCQVASATPLAMAGHRPRATSSATRRVQSKPTPISPFSQGRPTAFEIRAGEAAL